MRAQMSETRKTSSNAMAFIQGLAGLENLTAHATYSYKGGAKYPTRKTGITTKVVQAHLDGEQPIGCYFVLGEKAQAAVIDFDDHDKSMDWGDMTAAAKPIVDKLRE